MRRDNSDYQTYGELMNALVGKILRQADAALATSVLFALDQYTYDGSPKGAWQLRRGGQSCPVYTDLRQDGDIPKSMTQFFGRWQNKGELARALIRWLPDAVQACRPDHRPLDIYILCAGKDSYCDMPAVTWSHAQYCAALRSSRQIIHWYGVHWSYKQLTLRPPWLFG